MALNMAPRCIHQVASGRSVCSAPVRFSHVRLAPRSRATRLDVSSVLKTAPTVKMIIQGRKLQVTDAIKSYVENKISHCLAHYVQEVKEVDITISARGGHTGTHGREQQKVDVTVYTVRNGIVRVEDAEDTLYASIDLVADKLERKMNRIKERAISKGKWPGRAGPKGSEDEDKEYQDFMSEVAYETAVFDREQALAQQFAELNKQFPAISSMSKTVVRAKAIDVEPLSVDDAVEAMEAVGHSFYVFKEKNSGKIQVVYKRNEGDYGVLIPRS